MKGKKTQKRALETADITSKQNELRAELQGKVKSLVASFKTSPEKISEYFDFVRRFRQYSASNMMLIFSQAPNAKYVAPASLFAKGLPDKSGEPLSPDPIYIKKGERALRIWKPNVVTYIKNDDGKFVKLSTLTDDERRRAFAENRERYDKTSFLLVPVFDVGQTNLPSELYPKLFGFGEDMPELSGRINAAILYAENHLGCRVEIEDIGMQKTSARGYYNLMENKITLSDTLQGDGKLSTLLHEMGHAELHFDSSSVPKPLPQIELEADLYALLLEKQLQVATTDSRLRHLSANYNEFIKQCADISANVPFDNAIKRYQEQLPEIERYLAAAVANEAEQAATVRASAQTTAQTTQTTQTTAQTVTEALKPKHHAL